jgi:hypothetical protein
VASNWHPDLQVTQLEPWLVEIRTVYSVHPVKFSKWMEWHTLRDSLDLGDDPLWIIDCNRQAIEWSLKHLVRSSSLPAILRRWRVEPLPSLEAQLGQLHDLASLRPESQSAMERVYELITVRQGPFRPWRVLAGLRPNVEVG